MRSMQSRVRPVCTTVLATAVATVAIIAGAAPGAAADEGGGPGETGVRIVVRRGEIENGSRSNVRSVEMLALDGSSPTAVQTGWRVPIPTRRGEGEVPVQYQHVGLSVSLRAEVLGNDRIRLRGSIEDSTIDDRVALDAGSGTPTLRTFTQQLSAVVSNGEPTEVGSVVVADGASVFVEVEAEILD